MLNVFQYLSYVLFLNLYGNCLQDVSQLIRSNDICEFNNGKKFYVENGESGELVGSNVTLQNKYYHNLESNLTHSVYQCSIDIVTCPACVINIKITYMQNLSCQHDFLLIFEPPYDSDAYGIKLCDNNSNVTYRSLTRMLSLRFIYTMNHSDAFQLYYTAERNFVSIIGNASQSQHESISSPFFPTFYSRDYAVEYFIGCETEGCRIRLKFSDYLISSASVFEVYKSEDEEMRSVTYSGAMFRPSIIYSDGSSLKLKFFANGGTGVGFKALIDFINSEDIDDPNMNASTDCGGFVETLGGAITMMNMVKSQNDLAAGKNYDCIWVIKPPNTFLHLKTHLSIQVNAFENMIAPTELIIRQGITSHGNVLETISAEAKASKIHVVPLSSGFYVSLKGSFAVNSKVAVVYTAFSYIDCYIGSEFLCKNHKCIPIQLHCDGFDNCGDGSDEPLSCTLEWDTETFDRKWYSHTPNYYFPKTERYPDLKTATAVFMISSLGLIILISALAILLYRISARARRQRDLQNNLQTISDLLDNNRGDEILVDDPPVYEAPPDYEDVIKVGMNNQMPKTKDRKSEKKKRRSGHSRSKRRSRDYKTATLEVQLPLDSSSIISNSQLLEDNVTNNFFPSSIRAEITENPTSSTFACLCQEVSNRPCETTPAPESSPPSYNYDGAKRRKLLDVRSPIDNESNQFFQNSNFNCDMKNNWIVCQKEESPSTILTSGSSDTVSSISNILTDKYFLENTSPTLRNGNPFNPESSITTSTEEGQSYLEHMCFPNNSSSNFDTDQDQNQIVCENCFGNFNVEPMRGQITNNLCCYTCGKDAIPFILEAESSVGENSNSQSPAAPLSTAERRPSLDLLLMYSRETLPISASIP